MNYTAQQLRNAFYQAAANIEARPDLYDFHQLEVGEGNCPACMWGHVGRALRMSADMRVVFDVPESLGFHHHDLTIDFDGDISSHRMPSADYGDAARRLRAFADYHWPEVQGKPECLPDWNAMAMQGVEA